jgi:hypothetical protein
MVVSTSYMWTVAASFTRPSVVLPSSLKCVFVSDHQNGGSADPPKTCFDRSSFGWVSLPARAAYSSIDIGSVADG